MLLMYFKPFMDAAGVTTICPSVLVAIEGRRQWANCLVGSFIDKKLPFHIVQSYAMKLWMKYEITEVMMNDKAFFFFKFGTEFEMIQCLEDGPWLFQNRPILLKKWQPAMELSKEAPRVILLWVKLFDVPLEFWNNVGFSIASRVGKSLAMDRVTEDNCRLGSGRIGYARMLVEVDATRKLPEVLNVCTPCDESRLTKMPRPESRVECGDLPKAKAMDNEGFQLVTKKSKGSSEKRDIIGISGTKKSREELVLALEERQIEPPNHHKVSKISTIVEDKETVMEEESEMGNSDVESDKASMAEFIKEGAGISDHNPTVTVFPQYLSMTQKLKALKPCFRALNMKQGNLMHKVAMLRKEVENIQSALDLDPHNRDLREQETVFLGAFREELLDEERLLKQKSKIHWEIERISLDSNEVVEGQDMAKAFVDYY
ncbi:hypothetical protein Pint_25642 [Pistacia integerrima]|uniref:Uncharacterized protein n=1 Tax=Pistacia integerrima TaxID=434235 RepID=A0ACC0YHL9_9ROSI|nr:hypothetical protein Pint_25642 [Pistacia integerrima]